MLEKHDTNMEFPQHLGMDHDALDINDIKENILQSRPFHLCPCHKTLLSSYFAGILPDSPPDSGSDLSPHYSLSPDSLYNSDPGLYYPDYLEPGLSQVDCRQPLQIEAQPVLPSIPEAIFMKHTRPERNALSPVPVTVMRVNNPGVAEVTQEPPGSVTPSVVNKMMRRGLSEDTKRMLHFTAFQPTIWRETYSPDFQILKTPMLKVTADKGFNFSLVDDAFIAQKKNHFQLSCQVNIDGGHTLITTDLGCQKIEYFQLNFYGAKTEAPEQRIAVRL